MDFITVPLVLLIIFGTLYKVIKLYATRRERILYIEKMSTPPPYCPDANQQPIPPYRVMPAEYESLSRFRTLRWALLAMGVGFGMLFAIGFVLLVDPVRVMDNFYCITNRYGIIVGASMFLFGGLGMLISYIIETRYISRHTDNEA